MAAARAQSSRQRPQHSEHSHDVHTLGLLLWSSVAITLRLTRGCILMAGWGQRSMAVEHPMSPSARRARSDAAGVVQGAMRANRQRTIVQKQLQARPLGVYCTFDSRCTR